MFTMNNRINNQKFSLQIRPFINWMVGFVLHSKLIISINNRAYRMTPINTKEEQGLKIELNNVTSFDGLTMLHLATTIIYREMKSRSMAVPNLGPIVSEIEEDDDEDDGEQLGPDQETDGEKD